MVPTKTLAFILPLLLLANACTPMAEGVQETGDASKQVIYDTKKSWRGLFTYNPPSKIQPLPQTRYCYGMQSDIVCYDSPQPNMTAKLVGYQDGTNVSWVQPGGGSLGVSGGEPTAQPAVVASHTGMAEATAAPVPEVGSVDTSAPAIDKSCSGPTPDPFYCKESPYVKPAAK